MSAYLRAAERIEMGHNRHSCTAILLEHESPEQYAELFCPSEKCYINEAWGGYWGETTEERKACRVLALCFMHWISEEMI